MIMSFTGCQSSNPVNTETSDSSETSVTVTSKDTKNEKNTESTVQNTTETESMTDNSASDNKFDFLNFKNKNIFDIEKVDLFERDTSYRDELESKCETYEFYYLSDGYRIKAFISIPTKNIESEEPCKCLLYNRGGHWNYGCLNTDVLAYMSAVTGRVVVACELRGDNGSEGYDEFGGDELHDVFRLIDLCDEKFSFIDMDDFGVIGVSRGGMMTYMTAREDKRVKKIIVAGGISDLFSCYKERDDMNEMISSCIGGTPEEKPEEYKKRSAVCWADEIKIPVLMIHSKNDPKVKYETNAEALYKKIKDTTDCTFISHDDDYHGINPRKESQDIQEIVKFLNK